MDNDSIETARGVKVRWADIQRIDQEPWNPWLIGRDGVKYFVPDDDDDALAAAVELAMRKLA